MNGIRDAYAAAIIVAAGSSRRMAGVDKVFATLEGRPLLDYSLRVFDAHPAIGQIVVVASAERFSDAEALVKDAACSTPLVVALGGARRQDSVAAGLRRVPPGYETIVIHDAARPFVDATLIDRGLRSCEDGGAAIAAIPCRDTAKLVGPDMVVRQTVERSLLWLIQTPQVFYRDRLECAFEQVTDEVTDEATMLERCGFPVRVFEGSPFNIKVTVPEDLVFAEAIARNRAALA